MISVTDAAKEILHAELERVSSDDADMVIRLAPTPAEGTEGGNETRLGLVLDREQQGDQVIEHNGRRVLVVDQWISDQLDGATIDAVDTPNGRRLTLQR